jgi:hypothetical protein
MQGCAEVFKNIASKKNRDGRKTVDGRAAAKGFQTVSMRLLCGWPKEQY